MFLNLEILICYDKHFSDDNFYPRFNYFQICLYTINIVEILVKIYLHYLQRYINFVFI